MPSLTCKDLHKISMIVQISFEWGFLNHQGVWIADKVTRWFQVYYWVFYFSFFVNLRSNIFSDIYLVYLVIPIRFYTNGTLIDVCYLNVANTLQTCFNYLQHFKQLKLSNLSMWSLLLGKPLSQSCKIHLPWRVHKNYVHVHVK